MRTDNYIGRTLKELVDNLPEFAIGFHDVILNNKCFNLSDVLKKDDILSKKIKEIKVYNDYTIDIYLLN